MNKFKLALSAFALVATFVGISAGVNAQTAAPDCGVNPAPLNMWQKGFTVSGDTITTNVTLTGDTNCKKAITLAVWKAPSANGQPINDQVLFNHTTKTLGKGTHSISAKLPPNNCYYQADLLKGSSPTAPDGTANYGWQDGKIVSPEKNPLLNFKFGGDKVCKEEPKVCPHDSSMKVDDPNCFEKCPYDPTMRKDDLENCKPAEKPKTPETPVESLPSTGAGSIVASVLGLSSTTGLAYNYIRSRKQLR